MIRVRQGVQSRLPIADLGGQGEQAVLEVNGHPLLAGSRSRVAALAQDMTAQPHLECLVLARCVVSERSTMRLTWSPSTSVLTQVAHCFGSVTLHHPRQGPRLLPAQVCRVGDGVPLKFTLKNHGPATPVVIALLVERSFGPAPLYEVKLTGARVLPEVGAPHPRSIASWADAASLPTALGARPERGRFVISDV